MANPTQPDIAAMVQMAMGNMMQEDDDALFIRYTFDVLEHDNYDPEPLVEEGMRQVNASAGAEIVRKHQHTVGFTYKVPRVDNNGRARRNPIASYAAPFTGKVLVQELQVSKRKGGATSAR
ncbi:hypothetical protein LTR17_020953 [Elasticomyces elasticus]|nr:hypothetical protein LTR17_020953 [Elasticomyces elasticus]